MTSGSADQGTLVLVAGAGRSGTSTVAGALQRLGFHVPQPEVPADVTNPRGFYEAQWVVDFHKRILDPIPVRTNDARPVAVELTREAAESPELLDELVTWLSGSTHRYPQVVIKDPRSFWFHDLWRRAAALTQRKFCVLTMLRHPAEVAGSRAAYYLTEHSEDERRARETTNVAGWAFGTLVTERLSRPAPRAFVRYHDLMDGWRTALARADAQLGAGLSAAIDAGGSPPIDDFIDRGLHRVRATWDGSRVPRPLQQIAEGVWDSTNRLVESPGDPSVQATLDQLYDRYLAEFQYGLDLTLDQRKIEGRYSRQQARSKQQHQLDQLRKRNAFLEEENQRLRHRLRFRPRTLAGRVRRRLRRC